MMDIIFLVLGGVAVILEAVDFFSTREPGRSGRPEPLSYEEFMIKKYLDSLPPEERVKHCGTCGAELPVRREGK